jgi:surface protein
MTLEQLLYSIGRAAIRNKVINYAAAGGSISELNADTIKDYPILFAAPTGQHEVRTNTTDFEITLYYLDRLLSDNSNDVQIYSTAIEQLRFVLKTIEDIEGVVEVGENYTISNFTETEAMNDRVAGAFATVTITVMNISECNIEEIAGDWGKLQDKVIMITENGEYQITYDEGYTGLGTVELNVAVADSDGSYDMGYDDGYASGYIKGKEDGTTEGVEDYIETLPTLTITENGSYDTINKGVVVNVPDTNGSYREGYVDGVADGMEAGVADFINHLEYLTITENGTYDTINKGAFVNVPSSAARLSNYDGELDKNRFYQLGWTDDDIDAFILNAQFYSWESGRYEVPANNTSYYLDAQNGNWGNAANDENFVYCPRVEIGESWDIPNGLKYCKGFPLMDTSNVTDLDNAFSGCTSLITVPKFDTSNCSGMVNTFAECTSLKNVPKFDLSNINDMSGMFRGCTSLVSTPTFVLNTYSDRVDTTDMFNGCTNLKEVYFDNEDNVSIGGKGMFYDCTNLEIAPEMFTRYVDNMGNMFRNCDKLTSVPHYDTRNCKYMDYMFWHSANITTIPEFDMSNVLTIQCMFQYCDNLTTIPNLNTSKCNTMDNIIDYNNRKLTTIGTIDCSSVEGFYGSWVRPFGYSDIGGVFENFGGFLNLKYKLQFQASKLNYQSCINVLNGLYDFVGNNVTPSANEAQLKVHSNFLTTVGDDISIGINKGWTITT